MQKKIKRVTRQDVADYAGVTPTIVSYVINNNRYVEAGKRERVQKALKELGYRPNTMARVLKGKRSNHILFLVDDLRSEHFGKIMKHMNLWTSKNNYFISICESQNNSSFIREICEHYFDGIVIASGNLYQEYIQQIIDTHIPAILLGMRSYSALNGRYALIDSGLYEGARLCCRTLIEEGRRRLLFLDTLYDNHGSYQSLDDVRLQGFLDSLRDAGLYHQDYYRIINGCKTKEDICRATESILDEGFRIDGIFGRTDYVAIQAMYKLMERGYSIPNDCSVIGVNNARISRYISPNLSSLDINQEAIGDAIISMLDKFLVTGDFDESDNTHIKLETKLIKRESSMP